MSAAQDRPQIVEPRADFEWLTALLFKGSHYVESPFRRRKFRQDLIDSCEFYELHDRDRPGNGRRRGT
jgi:hypothetical protein